MYLWLSLNPRTTAEVFKRLRRGVRLAVERRTVSPRRESVGSGGSARGNRMHGRS